MTERQRTAVLFVVLIAVGCIAPFVLYPTFLMKLL